MTNPMSNTELWAIIGFGLLFVLSGVFTYGIKPMETEGKVTSVQTSNYILFSTTCVDFYGGGTDCVLHNSKLDRVEMDDQCRMKSNGYFLRELNCGTQVVG